jgi:uncharacterized membrane protein
MARFFRPGMLTLRQEGLVIDDHQHPGETFKRKTLMFKTLGIVFLVIMALSIPTSYAESRWFEIDEVSIHARIDDNGNMHVTEMDRYEFNGDFNGILIDLNTSGSDGIEQFQAFEISGDQEIPLEVEQTNDASPIQYRVYSQSENETKLFKFTYSLKNVVQVYADTAELYWKFFDQTNPSRLGKVEIVVELPSDTEQDKIHAFGHGPLDGVIDRPEPDIVRYTVSPLLSAQMLEVRVLFPVSYVPGSMKIHSEPMLERILEEERNWSSPTYESTAVEDALISLSLFMINLLAASFIYVKFGKAYRPEWKGKYYRELPADISPAVLTYLMKLRHETSDLMATMLDLVRKGYITMHAVKKPKLKEIEDYTFELKNKNKTKLLPHERALIVWFFEEIGKSGKLSLSDVRGQADSKKAAKAFLERWEKWQEHVKYAVSSMNYFEERPKNAKIYAWFVIGSTVQFLCLWWLIGDFHYIMLSPLPLLLFRTKTDLRSQKGQTEYTKWKAFKRFLLHYSRMASREPLAVHLWDHYYVYAMPLGVAKKLEAIEHQSLVGTSDNTSFYFDSSIWIHYELWTSSFDKAMTEGSKSISSSESSGGGTFSGGGGEGGGGGGRGAF